MHGTLCVSGTQLSTFKLKTAKMGNEYNKQQHGTHHAYRVEALEELSSGKCLAVTDP